MKRGHTAESLFVLLLYGVFALLSLFLVLTGAQVYRGAVRDAEANAEARASLSYVANKVRACDAVGGVVLDQRGGVDMLVLRETASDGAAFETLIYFYEGELRERFQAEGDGFDPAGGESLVELERFSVDEEDGMLVVSSTGSDGRQRTLRLARRAE